MFITHLSVGISGKTIKSVEILKYSESVLNAEPNESHICMKIWSFEKAIFEVTHLRSFKDLQRFERTRDKCQKILNFALQLIL